MGSLPKKKSSEAPEEHNEVPKDKGNGCGTPKPRVALCIRLPIGGRHPDEHRSCSNLAPTIVAKPVEAADKNTGNATSTPS